MINFSGSVRLLCISKPVSGFPNGSQKMDVPKFMEDTRKSDDFTEY